MSTITSHWVFRLNCEGVHVWLHSVLRRYAWKLEPLVNLRPVFRNWICWFVRFLPAPMLQWALRLQQLVRQMLQPILVRVSRNWSLVLFSRSGWCLSSSPGWAFYRRCDFRSDVDPSGSYRDEKTCLSVGHRLRRESYRIRIHGVSRQLRSLLFVGCCWRRDGNNLWSSCDPDRIS